MISIDVHNMYLQFCIYVVVNRSDIYICFCIYAIFVDVYVCLLYTSVYLRIFSASHNCIATDLSQIIVFDKMQKRDLKYTQFLILRLKTNTRVVLILVQSLPSNLTKIFLCLKVICPIVIFIIKPYHNVVIQAVGRVRDDSLSLNFSNRRAAL